jgi:hypothetical protein
MGHGLLNGILVGIVLWIAWGLGFVGITALRIQAAPTFPPGGSIVRQSSVGWSYVDYPDGLRYVIPKTGDRFIVTIRKTQLYEPKTGFSIGSYRTLKDCLVVDRECVSTPPANIVYTISRPVGSGIFKNFYTGAGTVYAYAVSGDWKGLILTDNGINAEEGKWLNPTQLREVDLGFLLTLLVVIVLGIPASLTGGVLLWLGFPADVAQALGPTSTLRTDRSAAIFRGAAISSLTVLTFAVIGLIGHYFRLAADIERIIVMAAALGLLAVALSTWGQLQAAQAWLAVRGRLPWRLMDFLKDAHARGVLRQSGAAYQFRHVRLQERLVARAGKRGRFSRRRP